MVQNSLLLSLLYPLALVSAQVALGPSRASPKPWPPRSTPSISSGGATEGAIKKIWQPKPGSKFQIVLDKRIIQLDSKTELVPDADIWDVDLFHTPERVIRELKSRGKHVICYFSAGGTETWRPDNKNFLPKDIGKPMRGWKGENWLDIRSLDVWAVMEKRIKMAADKGCSGIDPDNLDAFNNENNKGGGFAQSLTEGDTISYIQQLSNEAAKYGMATGLKNSEELLRKASKYVHFAVNEECASMDNSEGCEPYTSFLRSGKPVFHIEYAKYSVQGVNVTIRAESNTLRSYNSGQLGSLYCLQTALRNKKLVAEDVVPLFSTVIKVLGLDGWAMYCDGSWGVTKTTDAGAENVIDGKNDPRVGKGFRGPSQFGNGPKNGGREENLGQFKQGPGFQGPGMFPSGMGKGFRGPMQYKDSEEGDDPS